MFANFKLSGYTSLSRILLYISRSLPRLSWSNHLMSFAVQYCTIVGPASMTLLSSSEKVESIIVLAGAHCASERYPAVSAAKSDSLIKLPSAFLNLTRLG